MTTTEHLQIKPEYYLSRAESEKSKKEYINTNPRYRNFTQTIFHAGDIEQFETYRDATNGQICIPKIDLDENIFLPEEKKMNSLGLEWEGYQDIPATSVNNTFRYIYDKFKKGIFVKIQENKLKVFLPFSKINFINEWGNRIKVDPRKYSSLNDFFLDISRHDKYPFNPSKVNQFPSTWFGNNCLVRSEFPINEGDTGVDQVKDMFRTLCETRKVPDLEFFVNRRDFPILKRDYTEPYEHLFDNEALPLLSHKYPKYSPIFSNVTGKKFADVPIPTPDDWCRVSYQEGKYFPKDCKLYDDIFDTPWEQKKPIAVFRGSSTGCGITTETNMRLKIAMLSAQGVKNEEGLPYLDAGITKWNVRPRKIKGQPYLVSLDVQNIGFDLVEPLTPEEQSKYKYIINIDGHVSAFRLSMELSMGSVILKVNSPYKMWYDDLLVPDYHYVKVNSDLSNLYEKIDWCRAHDLECQRIAANAKTFYEKYLSKEGILDYLQLLVLRTRQETGVYLYNYKSPLKLQIEYETRNIDTYFPKGSKGKVNSFPLGERSYSLLQGTQWAINYILSQEEGIVPEKLEALFPQEKLLVQSVHSRIYLRKFLNTPLIISKELTLKEKLAEGIHETFVGTRGINLVLKKIPNFVYTFGIVNYQEHFEILQEYIPGIQFLEYLKSSYFKIRDYLLILIQICMALEVAQNTCGFVHYDLFPWNVVLNKTKNPIAFDYPLDKNRIYRIQSSIIPIIIDYGKSGIIYKERHHGYAKPYKVSRIQDVISILISSLNIILKERKVSHTDFSVLLKLSNFISGTKFNPTPFNRSKELKEFLRREHKFSVMLESEKYELENRTPYDLVKYIMDSFPDYQFPVFERSFTEFTMNKGNSRQVFDYYLADTVEEKIKSYTDVFLRFKKCTIPQPTNIIYVYYVLQTFYDNLTSVNQNLLNYLKLIKMPDTQIKKQTALYEDTLNYLRYVYGKKIKADPVGLKLTVEPSSEILIQAPYSQETFLLPGKIEELLKLRGEMNNLGETREIFVGIFNNDQYFRLPEKIRKFYARDLERLFRASTLALKNNYANMHTLGVVSEEVFSNDLVNLEEKLEKTDIEKCEDVIEAQEYLAIYKEILQIV